MKRLSEYLLLAILAFFVLAKGVIPSWTDVHSDFANYYVSAKLVVAGAPLDKLYDNSWFQQKIMHEGLSTPGKFSPFPPATAWIMLPLTPFDALTAQRIFTVINMVFIVWGILLLAKITALKPRYCAMIVLGGGLGLVNNIAFGQVYWIMTVFMLYSLVMIRNGKPSAAGIILGTFASIKYFPIILVAGCAVNLLVERWTRRLPGTESRLIDAKIIFSALSTLSIIVAMEFLFFGSQVMSDFFHSSFIPHLDGQLIGQGLYSFQYQSWDNFFRNLFVSDPSFNPNPFIDWPQGRLLLKSLILALVSAIMIFLFYRYKDSETQKRRAVYLAVATLTALVILPASATYHFAMILIPLAIIVENELIEKKWAAICIGLYALMGFIPYGFAFQLSKAWGLPFAYPRLFLVSVLYMAVMILLARKTNSFVS